MAKNKDKQFKGKKNAGSQNTEFAGETGLEQLAVKAQKGKSK
ncbi:hypothetical protein [Ectobacillus ponti]|nr:hypothetical protein [Ectobacillus ponti]